jgi:hypothetical protein
LDAFTAAEYALRTQRIANQGRVNQAIIVLVPLLSTFIAVGLPYGGWREIGRAGRQFAAALTRAEEASRAKDKFMQPFRTN